MTPVMIEELQRVLAHGQLPIAEATERIRQAGSAWTRDQLLLLAQCYGGLALSEDGLTLRLGGRSETDELQDALRDAVASFGGRPVPPAEVRRRLPDRFVTTDEQIRALARKTEGLSVVGPGYIQRVR